MCSINARIAKVREFFCNGSNKEFARAVGKTPNNASNWTQQGYSVGRGVVSDISKAFPSLNEDWLLTGKGEMLKAEVNNKKDKLELMYEHLRSLGAIHNKKEFAASIDFNYTNLSSAFKGSEKYLTAGLFTKIDKKFPDVFNRQWFLENEGEMLKAEPAIPDAVEAENVPVINYERRGVPYYDVDFLCGFDLIENDQTVNAECYIDFKQYNRADFWINASGDSMRPSISPGDLLAVKQLPVIGWEAHIMYGETYALVTEYNRTIKKIRKSTKGDAHILLVPENTADYDEQDVQKKDIRRVFQVLGCMKSFV